MQIIPPLLTDSYKTWHFRMYLGILRFLYSNMTPRKSRIPGIDKVVFFGLQYYLKEYLIRQWNEGFFKKDWGQVEREIKRFHRHFSFSDIDTQHWKELWELGYMPLKIKALPEGTLCPIGVPFFTITNTDQRFAWLVNFLETQMSTVIWDHITVATIASEYRKIFDKYALLTTGSTDGVQWQGHDFSMRGRSSIESSYNQAGHLLSFTGTDTIPAVLFLEEYYEANMTNELIGASVPATEHSVMMAGGKDDELGTFRQLLAKFQSGILSVVSDTWSLPHVLTDILPRIKNEVMKREGKLVIRPDSFWTNPADCLCGYDGYHPQMNKLNEKELITVKKGLIESLWDIFGGTTNALGYKVLDPHIGAIYGDAITLTLAEEINQRLMAKGFASINWVAGIGSFTYNHNTRDTFGMAIKATNCTVETSPGLFENRQIFKDPVTDSGEKKSAKGLLMVYEEDGVLKLKDQCTLDEEEEGLLEPVFLDGKLLVNHTLTEIRQRLNG